MIITCDKNQVSNTALKAIEQTNTLITFWDNNFICRFANNACHYWFERKPEEIIDKIHLSELIGHHFEENLKHMNDVLSGQAQMFERIIDTPDGLIRRGNVVYIPEIVKDSIVGFYAYLFDFGPLVNNGKSSLLSRSSQLANPSNQVSHDVEQELKAYLLTKFPGLAFLAKQHMVSESKLKRDFKQKYGKSIFSYFSLLQMQLAEDYIREKKYTKSQLAMLFNFSNPSNFSSCYRKYLLDNLTITTIQQNELNSEQSYDVLKNPQNLSTSVLDKELRFLDASENWIEYHRLGKLEIIGMKMMSVLHISNKLKQSINKALNGTVQELVEQSNLESELPRWTNWNISPWHNAKGIIQGLVVITKGITSPNVPIV